jgi:hypothetical protein
MSNAVGGGGGGSSVASPAVTIMSHHTSGTAALQLPSPTPKGGGRRVRKGFEKVRRLRQSCNGPVSYLPPAQSPSAPAPVAVA